MNRSKASAKPARQKLEIPPSEALRLDEADLKHGHPAEWTVEQQTELKQRIKRTIQSKNITCHEVAVTNEYLAVYLEAIQGHTETVTSYLGSFNDMFETITEVSPGIIRAKFKGDVK